MSVTVIGIAGQKRSGKDTVCNTLMEVIPNSRRRAMADSLKDEVAHFLAPACNKSYIELRAEFDNDATKERYRLLLQWWGTDFRRKQDPDYWVDRIHDYLKLATGTVIIPDIRFPNEAELVQRWNGQLLKVVREGLPDDTHASENALSGWDMWDFVIDNYSTVEDLQTMVKHLAKKLVGG